MSMRTETPAGVEELAELLKASSAGDRPVVPVGGATATDIGNAPASRSVAVSMAALAGVVAYQPADLTLTVLAGTPMASVQAALAEQGQELPIDVPRPRQATIGGLVATGFAGPRRLGSGSLKDILLGCSFVTGDGRIAKAGGSVVKNVSGFEIPRLLHGSWGSLAVMTSINLKVTPIPKADVTLVRDDVPADDVMTLAQRIRAEYPSVVAIETDRADGGIAMAVRLMGRDGALQVQATELRQHNGFDREVRPEFWQERLDRLATPGDYVQVVLATRPRSTVEALVAVSERLGPAAEVAMSPGLGTARMRFAPSLDAGSFWQRVELETLPPGTRLAIEFAPAAWGDGVDRWGQVADGIATMRAIKDAFDPNGILNRGRLFI